MRIGQHKVIRNSANQSCLGAKSLEVIRIFLKCLGNILPFGPLAADLAVLAQDMACEIERAADQDARLWRFAQDVA